MRLQVGILNEIDWKRVTTNATYGAMGGVCVGGTIMLLKDISFTSPLIFKQLGKTFKVGPLRFIFPYTISSAFVLGFHSFSREVWKKADEIWNNTSYKKHPLLLHLLTTRIFDYRSSSSPLLKSLLADILLEQYDYKVDYNKEGDAPPTIIGNYSHQSTNPEINNNNNNTQHEFCKIDSNQYDTLKSEIFAGFATGSLFGVVMGNGLMSGMVGSMISVIAYIVRGTYLHFKDQQIMKLHLIGKLEEQRITGRLTLGEAEEMMNEYENHFKSMQFLLKQFFESLLPPPEYTKQPHHHHPPPSNHQTSENNSSTNQSSSSSSSEPPPYLSTHYSSHYQSPRGAPNTPVVTYDRHSKFQFLPYQKVASKPSSSSPPPPPRREEETK